MTESNLGILERLKRITEDEQAINEQLGFEGHWRVYPFDNQTHASWLVVDDRVVYFNGIATPEDIEAFKECEGNYYSGLIVRGAKSYHNKEQGLTAFVLNTECDGNIFFTIFKDELRLDIDKDEIE